MVVWEKVVEELPDAVLAIDAGGRVCFANVAAGDLLGVAPQDLEGRPAAELVPERSRLVEGRPFHQRFSGAPGACGHFTGPVVFRGGVEIEVDWTICRAGEGSPAGTVVAVLRRRPAALDRDQGEESAYRVLKLVFEHAPIGIFHFDERGVLTACNDRFVEILGSTRQRLVGLALRMLPNDAICACIDEALAGRHARFDGSYSAVTGNRVTPVRVDFEPILGPGGRVLGGVGLAEDVSARQDAERRAARAERLASLGTLAAGVVHELQNPLAFVVANLDLALRLLTEGEARSAVGNAREGAWRVATIVRDLKAFARSDEDVRRPVDVHVALESALKLVADHLAPRASVRRSLAARRMVRASEPRLVQLFVNLLLNAAEAVPEGDPDTQWVSVATRDEGEAVVIEVEDSGRGIAADLKDRLFEPFVTDKPGAMGLGLAICHGICASLGGSISAFPVARGARIEVRLPALTTAEVAPASPPVTPRRAARARGRVLVVDDEERLAETLRMALSPPHDVQVCTRSRDVLAWIAEGRDWDVILCDLMMPDLSGPELFAQVRALRPELAERFVFLTGGAFTAQTRDFLHDVPNPRLEKPFDLGDLEQIVSDALAARE